MLIKRWVKDQKMDRRTGRGEEQTHVTHADDLKLV